MPATPLSGWFKHVLVVALASAAICAPRLGLTAEPQQTIAQVKPSIVAIGTYQRTRNPQFSFRGTGFAIGDGTLIATNAHVLPGVLDAKQMESLVVLVPVGNNQGQVRETEHVAVDPAHDLAILRAKGPPLKPLALRDSDSVQEGQVLMFTGFPIGAVLGLFPATHRGMVASITPIVIPPPSSDALDARTVRRLQGGAFPVFQLDGTAYPGNSGSPLYDPASGEVVGVINMVFVKGTKESALSQPSGISYAIPSKYLQELMRGAK